VGESVIGEICHIRASRAGGSRFDATQDERARHAFPNLILLCPTHHSVIDADPEAYTIDRLLRMKADHEGKSGQLDEAEIGHGTRLLTASINISGGDGGVTAHTINVGSINTGVSRSSAFDERTVKAIDTVWGATVALENEFSDLTFIDGILTPEEIQACIDGTSPADSMMQQVQSYPTPLQVMRRLQDFASRGVDKEQPYAPRLFAMFFVHQAVFFRAALLMSQSVEGGRHKDWRKDSGIEQQLSSLFTKLEIVDLLAWRPMGLSHIGKSIQSRMQVEIAALLS
jgi:hypothetical protein